MDRESALRVAADRYEEALWHLMEHLEHTLRDLATVSYFDANDPTAIGSALHSALPQAFKEAELSKWGLDVQLCKTGPCYKIIGRMTAGAEMHDISIELHYAGPQGGTSKTRHQFANADVDEAPWFPGFDLVAPETLLCFLAYYLDGAKVRVDKLFLIFADGIDRKRVQLYRPAASASKPIAAPVPLASPSGAKLKIKGKARGDSSEHVSKTDKRGDAASSS